MHPPRSHMSTIYTPFPYLSLPRTISRFRTFQAVYMSGLISSKARVAIWCNFASFSSSSPSCPFLHPSLVFVAAVAVVMRRNMLRASLNIGLNAQVAIPSLCASNTKGMADVVASSAESEGEGSKTKSYSSLHVCVNGEGGRSGSIMSGC